MIRSADVITKLLSLTQQALSATSKRSGYQIAMRYTSQVRSYLDLPHLLDPHMPHLITPLIENLEKDMETGEVSRPWLYTMLYILIEVRKFSFLTRYFPNHVKQLEPCIRLLTNWYAADLFINSLDKKDVESASAELIAPTFNTVYDEKDVSANAKQNVIYVLFACLSILVRVPFDIHSVDSNGTMPSTVISLAKKAFASGSNEYIIAAEMLAHFITRPDLRDVVLCDVLADINLKLAAYSNELKGKALVMEPVYKCGKTTVLNQIPAYLITLSYIIHFSDRKHIKSLHDKILVSPEQTLSVLLKDDNREVRRLCIVLATRLSTMHLPQQPFLWQMQLSSTGGEAVLLHHDKMLELEGFYVPEAFDYFIDSLLVGISDSDTGIRLSSAKGLALVVGRLPYLFADEVIVELLSYFSPAETLEMWHGASVALGEIVRNGYLPPSRISEVFTVVCKSLQFERKRGAGSIVKDAACFVSWALARRYSACTQLHSICRELASELLIVACFDKEINIRRSAAAAYQELAGRVGEPYVPSAVRSSALVDYFALGSKTVSYLEVSPQLASLDSFYAAKFIEAICNRYLIHWDAAIRDLAARTLYRLLQQTHKAECCDENENDKSPVLTTIHFLKDCLENTSCEEDWVLYCGFILGISNCIRLLCTLGESFITELNNLILYLSTVHAELFKTGKHFKDNAEANINIVNTTAILIREFAGTDPLKTAKSVLNEKAYASYLSYLLSNLEYTITMSVDNMSIAMFDTSNTNEIILALQALSQYHDKYEELLNRKETNTPLDWDLLPSNDFLKKCIDNINKRSLLAYLTGLGLLPTSFRRAEIDYILNAIRAELNKGIRPAGYVVRLYILSTIESTVLSLTTITDDQRRAVIEIIRVCLQDYSSNQRGDIGSLVRLKAFRVLRNLLRRIGVLGAFLEDTYIEAAIKFLGSRIDIMRIDALISIFEDQQDGVVQLEGIAEGDLTWYMQDYILERKLVQAMKENARQHEREQDELDSNTYLYDLHRREARDDDPLGDDTNINLLTLVPGLSFTAFNVLIVLFMTVPRYADTAAEALAYSFGAMTVTTSAYLIKLLSELFGKYKWNLLLTGSTSNHIRMPNNLQDKIVASQDMIKAALYRIFNNVLSNHNLTDPYSLNMTDASLKLLDFCLANRVYIEQDEVLFNLFGNLLALAKITSNMRILQLIIGCLAAAGVVAAGAGYQKTRERATKGLILFLGHRICKLRDSACDGLLELLLLATWLEASATTQAIETLVLYDWSSLTTEEINDAREALCGSLNIDPPRTKKT